MHLNEIKNQEQASLGFLAELAYATLPRNTAHKHQLNLL